MKNLRRMVEKDLDRSIPTLGAASQDMTGWCNRMIREYGRQTMAMMMAEAVKACPSPSLDGRIREWAGRQPRCQWHTALVPYWAMNHMVYELMKMERPGACLEANAPNRPAEPHTAEPSRIPLYAVKADM